MSIETAFIRQLATALRPIRNFNQHLPTEEAAAAFFHRVVFQDRCPTCAGPAKRRHHQVRCPCGGRSLTANTPLRNTKLPLRTWLAAIWHLHVDTVSITSRRFAHLYATRAMTAWSLLHRVRDAFERSAPTTRGATRQLLGRQSPRNLVHVVLARDGGTLAAGIKTTEHRSGPPTSRELGYLHAWMVSLFRGVTRAHLSRYLDEYAARANRRAPT